jgi:hypothetical protein
MWDVEDATTQGPSGPRLRSVQTDSLPASHGSMPPKVNGPPFSFSGLDRRPETYQPSVPV